MSGKSSVLATPGQRAGLALLAGSRDRGEADRARAVLLTVSGWTSVRIAEAFGVREDTVRLWRSDFMRGGADALKATLAPGPAPVKSEAALRVAMPLLAAPVADRPNWTIPRLRADIERVGLRLRLRQQQAAAGDIVLLYGDESAAPTHPSLARAGAKSGADLRVPAPGQPVKPVVLVEDNGPIHTSKLSQAALAARAHWLTVEWLPKYQPEQAIHHPVNALNSEQMPRPLDEPRISA